MTASTKDSTFLLFMSSYPSQLSNKCKEIASKSNRDDYGNENVKSNGFMNQKIAVHVHHTFWYLLLQDTKEKSP